MSRINSKSMLLPPQCLVEQPSRPCTAFHARAAGRGRRWRCGSDSAAMALIRIQYHLDTAALMPPECPVCFRRLRQAHAIGNQKTGIDFAATDALQQRLHVAQ